MTLAEIPRSRVIELCKSKPLDSAKPWLYEPDVMQWTDETTGLKCVIRRVRGMGHLCGYVRIMRNHPAYGKDTHQMHVDVHGGVTFARRAPHKRWMRRGYWVGFDCAHLYDLIPVYQSPALQKLLGESNTFSVGTYRDMEFVYLEVQSLALQLSEKQARRGKHGRR